jgi:hypothetical protein
VGFVGGERGAVTVADFGPDGRRAVVSSAEETRVFDVASASEAWAMTRRHGSVKSVRFSPDGSLLLAGYAGGVARLWFTDPLAKAPSLRPRELTLQEIEKHGTADPQAVAGVMRLFDDAFTNEELVETLERRANLSDGLRAAAIEAALTRDPRIVAERLRRRSWAVVVRPLSDPERYATALKWIEVALTLWPEVEDGLTTLGAAQYRVGRHQRALETLEAAFRKSLASARSYARVRNSLFIAMAHAKLGEAASAATALFDARRMLGQLGRSPPEEVRKLMEEAARTIEPPGGSQELDGK